MKNVMDSDHFIRTLKRIAHEIIEKNDDLSKVVLVGILKKGYPIAKYLSDLIYSFEGIQIPVEKIDISKHRDDEKRMNDVSIDFSVSVVNKVVILVDDVLYTGRSVRAALDAIIDLGRPAAIELAILVDRGHREVPIRPDYIGKNMPTGKEEHVICDFENKTISIDN